MEKNKRLISILTVCLLSALAVLPLFSVTVSASGSITDPNYYYPDTQLSFSVTGFHDVTDSEIIHFPVTYVSGHEFTHSSNYTDSDGNYFGVEQTIDQTEEFPPILGNGYFDIPQYCTATINAYTQTHVCLITFRLQNLYVFVDYFDDFPDTLKGSFIGSVDTDTLGLYSSLSDGTLSLRYREVGDELYSEVISNSETFAPYMESLDDGQGDTKNPETVRPTNFFKFDEYDNLPFFEQEKLYHVDELSVTFYCVFHTSTPTLTFDSHYYNVLGIDNIVITKDMSNVDLPLRDFTSWLGTATSGFFTAEIAPGFSLGGIVMMCLAFALVIWFLKIFAGG